MTYVNTQVPHNEEYAAAVLSNGSVLYLMVTDQGGTVSLPLGIMLLLHTHPYGAQPMPSDADKATAEKVAAPNCVVTATKVWWVMPSGKVVRGELAARQATSRSLLGNEDLSGATARRYLHGWSPVTRRLAGRNTIATLPRRGSLTEMEPRTYCSLWPFAVNG